MENNKITVPLEVAAGEAMAESAFFRNRNLVAATNLHNTQLAVEELQQEVEILKSENALKQAEIDRLTARINAPQMPAIIDNDEVMNGE